MNPLEYILASTSIRVLHARQSEFLEKVLKSQPNNKQLISELEDSLTRCDEVSLWYNMTERNLKNALYANKHLQEIALNKEVEIREKTKRIKDLEQQLKKLKQNLEL